MFKDETGEIVPAIVSEELWDKANAVLQRRSEDVKNRQGICNHANLLTGKLFCTSCGLPYYRRESKDKHGNVNSKWVCSGKINNGAESCGSFAIFEAEIKPLLFEVFKETEADVEALIEEYVKMYKSLHDEGDVQKKIDEREKLINLAVKKKGKLLEYNVTGQVTDKEFVTMKQQCEDEIQQAEAEIAELSEQDNSRAEFKKHIDTIRQVLRDAQKDATQGVINKGFIDKYIDKIFITPQDGAMRLEIKLFTGETTSKFLEKFRSRTGHTSKKMIESYERGHK
jgi:hypothetical protein